MTEIILKNGQVEDTVSLCKKTILDTLHETSKIASVLRGENRLATAKNIYDFIINYIQYNYDHRDGDIEAIERVRTPSRMWADRKMGGDCEDYSILISSILMNLGIPHSLRITKFDNKPNWQHIYVVMPTENGTIVNIDPVVDWQFNYEVPYTAKKDFQMPVREQRSTLAGFPAEFTQTQNFMKRRSIDALDFTINGLGAIATDVQLVTYFKQIATANNYSLPASLSSKIQGTRNWVASNNDQNHPLWKYADIYLKSGAAASNNAINTDIARLKDQIWPTNAPATPSRIVNSAPLNPTTTTVVPVTTSTSVTASVGSGELFSKKNMMIAGGAVAALGLAFVLLK